MIKPSEAIKIWHELEFRYPDESKELLLSNFIQIVSDVVGLDGILTEEEVQQLKDEDAVKIRDNTLMITWKMIPSTED